MTKPIADQILDLIAAETAEKAQDDAAHDANIAALKAALATVAPPATKPIDPPAPVPVDPPAPAPAPVDSPAPAPGTVPGTPVPGTPPATPPAAPVPVVRPDVPSLFDPTSPIYTDKVFLPDGEPIPVSPNQWKAVITSGSGSTKLYVAIDSDPPIDLHTSNGQLGDETAGVVLTGDATMRIDHWPPNVVPGTGGDNDVVIVDITTRKVISLYQVAFDGTNWSARDIAYGDLDGSGFGSAAVPRVGICAAGTSPALGLVLKRELGDGSKPINHALRMAIGEYAALRGPVPPCYAEDDPKIVYKGKWALGRFVMIDPKFDVSQFQNLRIRQIAMTLQTKGAIVTDTCGDATPFAFYYEIGAGVDFDWQASADTELLRSLMVPVKWPQDAVVTPTPDQSLYDFYGALTGDYPAKIPVSEAELAALPLNVGAFGPLKAYWPDYGARDDIGKLPAWDVRTIVSGDPRATKYSDSVAKLSITMPFHYPDKTTRLPFILTDGPQATFQDDYPPITNFVDVNANLTNPGWTLDLQHSVHFQFTAALVAWRAGDRASFDLILLEMQHLLSWLLLQERKDNRGYHRGIINAIMGSAFDLRGAAWGLVLMVQVACLMELDKQTSKPYYLYLKNVAIPWNWKWIAQIHLADTPVFDGTDLSMAAAGDEVSKWSPAWGKSLANNIGVMARANSAYFWTPDWPFAQIGAFQHHFFTSALQYAYGMAKAGSIPVDSTTLEYMRRVSMNGGKFSVMLATLPVDFRRGTHQYDISVGYRAKNPDGSFNDDAPPIYFKDAQEFWDKNLTLGGNPDLGPLPTETPPIIRNHNSNDDAVAFGSSYAANWWSTIAGAVRDGVDGAQDTMLRVMNSKTYRDSWQTMSRCFFYVPKGFDPDPSRIPVTSFPPGPVVVAPAPDPAPVPTFQFGSGIYLAKDTDTNVVLRNDATIAYGVPMNFVVFKLRAGTYSPFDMGALGIPDLAPGVYKKAYIVDDSVPVTTKVTYPDVPASPPAGPIITVPAPTGTPIDPSTWLTAEGTSGDIPLDRTIYDTLPADRKGQAINYVDQWPATAWLPETWVIANINGGHQVGNVAGVIQTSLRTLTRRFTNQAKTLKNEADMPADGTPDNEGVIKAMHGFDGYVGLRKRWGLAKDFFGVLTLYFGGPTPMGFYDPDAVFGGGDVIYKGDRNKWFNSNMGYAKAVECDDLNGFFAGDAWHYQAEPQLGLVAYDKASEKWLDPDYSWPDPIAYGNGGKLLLDTERKLLIGFNAGDSGYPNPSLVMVSYDQKSPRYKQQVEMKFQWPDEISKLYCISPDRFGFSCLKGKGIVGVGNLQLRPDAPAGTPIPPSYGIQIKLGADPFVDQPTITIPFRNEPIPPYGVWGMGHAIDELGITAYDYAIDKPMRFINWPKV